jgi:hypothetical protein
MPNAPERAQQRHTRDKSIIDHVARNVPKKVPDTKQPKRSPTTSTGQIKSARNGIRARAAVSPPSKLGSAHDAKRRTAAGHIKNGDPTSIRPRCRRLIRRVVEIRYLASTKLPHITLPQRQCRLRRIPPLLK